MIPIGTVELVTTSIELLDDLLGGGIPKNSLVLVVGPTGAMKSTLVYTILYNNSAHRNAKALYLSIEKRREAILGQMHDLGMASRSVTANIQLIDIAKLRKRSDISRGKEWLEIFKRFILSLKTNFPFEFLVIDSITALALVVGEAEFHDEVFDFFEWLRELEATVFIVSNIPEGNPVYAKHHEDMFVDGIIALSRENYDDRTVERRIQCVKMRTCNHELHQFPFVFDNEFKIIK